MTLSRPGRYAGGVAGIRNPQASEQASEQASQAIAKAPRRGRPGNPAVVEVGKPYRFQPGQSGNPSGRPKGLADFRARIAGYSEKAERTIVELLDSDNDRVRLAAASELLDRLYGRPTSMLADADGKPVQLTQVTYVEILQRLAGSGG